MLMNGMMTTVLGGVANWDRVLQFLVLFVENFLPAFPPQCLPSPAHAQPLQCIPASAIYRRFVGALFNPVAYESLR
jgi:hypothetical protein